MILTQVLSNSSEVKVDILLELTAEERIRVRRKITTESGQEIILNLPRGTVLRDRDLLATDDGQTVVQIAAKPELLLSVTATDSLTLLRAAYHLGNRHVSLEIGDNYLRLNPDPILKSMLEQLGLTAIEELAPFQPEPGAYIHHH